MSTDRSPPPGPNLFLIGAAKCATTSVWSYLDAHPEIFMSEPKEPGYFDGTHDLEAEAGWYTSLFEQGAGHPVIGEASTTYTRDRSFPGTASASMSACLRPSCCISYASRSNACDPTT